MWWVKFIESSFVLAEQLTQKWPISDTVDLDSMEYEEEEEEGGGAYSTPCRCGGSYTITEHDLEEGVDVVCCSTCTLSIRILYQLAEKSGGEEERVWGKERDATRRKKGGRMDATALWVPLDHLKIGEDKTWRDKIAIDYCLHTLLWHWAPPVYSFYARILKLLAACQRTWPWWRLSCKGGFIRTPNKVRCVVQCLRHWLVLSCATAGSCVAGVGLSEPLHSAPHAAAIQPVVL